MIECDKESSKTVIECGNGSSKTMIDRDNKGWKKPVILCAMR